MNAMLPPALAAPVVRRKPQPALVFLPGLFTTREAWEPLCRQLGLENRLMLNLPGHGGGETGDQVARSLQDGSWLEVMADRITTFAKDRPVHLVGHSSGGLVSLLLAQRMAKRVHSMVLVGAPVTGRRDRARDIGAALFAHDHAGRLAWPLLWPLWLASRTAFERGMASVTTPEAARKTPEAMRQALRRCDPEAIRQFGKWVLAQDVTGIMAGIETPVLAIIGRSDAVVPAQHQLKLLQHLPKAQAQLVPGRHLPFLENPLYTGRALRGWLTLWQDA
ncbi:alpha/beta fold hydrolase [Antarctobacter jejuensis]|uniref:alpha/beta fold hydrolase n=1 Tax=Antarctobacter jejuensis TaxID=1439938 RepID=UPI003FD6A096